MTHFKIVNNLNELKNQTKWNIPLNSKKSNKLYDEKGAEVQSNYEGRQYQLHKRGHTPSGCKKFGLAILVICSLGTALFSKYIYNALIKGRVTKNFGIRVESQKVRVSETIKKTINVINEMPSKMPSQKPLLAEKIISENQKLDLVSEKTIQTQEPAVAQHIDLDKSKQKQKGIDIFSYLLDGLDNYNKLPILDFNTLGTRKEHIGNNQYIDRPAWISRIYPDIISVEALNKIDGPIIRGINGLKNYEYLIFKYFDDANDSGMFVFYCENETGEFSGCSIHGGGEAFGLDNIIYHMKCEVEDKSTPELTRILSIKEKYKIFCTTGALKGKTYSGQKTTVTLKS